MLANLERGSKQNPPIVFLHGFLGQSKDWFELIRLLEEKYYCLCIDLPGHGQSPTPEKVETNFFEVCNELILEVLEAKSIEKAVFVGYSLGGRLALNFAKNNPKTVERLILISAHFGLENSAEKQERYQEDLKWANHLEHASFPAFLKEWYSRPVFQSLSRQPTTLGKLLIRRQFNNPLALARILPALSLAKQPTTLRCLQSLPMKKLLITGELDQKFKQIYQDVPDIKKCYIANAGHAPHMENPRALLEHFYNFLTETSSYVENS